MVTDHHDPAQADTLDERKVALVTGASAGIGLAIAKALANEGYNLGLVARDPSRLRAAVDEIESLGVSALPISANLAKEDELERAFAEHVEHFGRIDVLINNAGLGVLRVIADTSPKQLDLQLSVNLRAAYRLMSLSFALLQEAASRHHKALVVNVSSMVADHARLGAAAYGATKAALVALSASAHCEWSDAGIQVTALCPGSVSTTGYAWADSGDRAMPPSDVAEAVRFLLRTSTRCFVTHMELATAGTTLDLGPALAAGSGFDQRSGDQERTD
jgi:NAD(P)-dependent dehydrogenase (short-subunit alcohol dehydrogenase family)